MKKLVAISVLFVGLAMAVSAQSGGWSNEWKFGLSATFITDMFFAGSASGKSDTTQTTTPSTYTGETAEHKALVDAAAKLADDQATTSTEWGKHDKGMTAFFPNTRYLPDDVGGDNRLTLTIENSGENYNFWVDIAYDNWTKEINNGLTVGNFLLNGEPKTDWNFSGNAGIFDIHLGTKSGYGGWVDTCATWGSWIAWNQLCRFGVARGFSKDDYVHSDNFRTWNQWGAVFATGIKLGDNFKLGLGYRLNPAWSDYVAFSAYGTGDSKSSINAAFMLSGRPVDMITFDLFYAVIGHDADTFSRPVDNLGYNKPVTGGDWKATDYWRNTAGVYVGVNGIENLAINFGYTANFNVYDTGSFVYDNGDLTKSDPVTYVAPIYSGIDLRLGFSGIDRIGLKFNNNVSLAGVQGENIKADVYQKTINLDLSEKSIAPVGVATDWFFWQSVLQAQLGFIEGVGLEFTLANKLGVTTTNTDRYFTETDEAISGYLLKKTETSTDKNIQNEFRAVLGAKYGEGNVSLGIALFLSWTNTSRAYEGKTTVSTTYPGTTITDSVVEQTIKTSSDVVKFGIPITVSVSF
jgi:hypothetical protein